MPLPTNPDDGIWKEEEEEEEGGGEGQMEKAFIGDLWDNLLKFLLKLFCRN